MLVLAIIREVVSMAETDTVDEDRGMFKVGEGAIVINVLDFLLVSLASES